MTANVNSNELTQQTNTMKIIFFGSDDFAAAHLKSLIGSSHKVVACVTQPDRPKGRGMKVVVSPVKECARNNNIPVLQPTSLKEDAFIEDLKDFQSDAFVVIAYGQFLPSKVLDIPSFGAINVHPSLLPKYRGAAPINWVIINGEEETGISIIKINEEMDAGDILAETRIKIKRKETAVTLRARMVEVGPLLLQQTLDILAGGTCVSAVQDHQQATLAPKLTKELGAIQWAKKAGEIDHLIRGLLPWPSAYTFYKGKLLKILEAQIVEGDFSQHESGTVSEVGKEGITVATGCNGLLVRKVHLQDSKPMDAHSFVVGHEVEVGFQFK